MLGLGGSVNLDIILDPNDRRKFLKFRENHKNVKLPIYSGNDDISGVVIVEVKDTRRFEHLGLRIEIIGHLGTLDG
jgi:vacuolar protein sorting-associated protein 26